jgi:hypothetical protein
MSFLSKYLEEEKAKLGSEKWVKRGDIEAEWEKEYLEK